MNNFTNKHFIRTSHEVRRLKLIVKKVFKSRSDTQNVGTVKKLNFKQRILLICGFLLVALGFIGIVLPILPTTPFIIAAALCFSASLPVFAQKLEKSKYFGSYIRHYKDKTGIPFKQKMQGILFLWAVLLISVVLSRSILVFCILCAVGVGVTIHIAFIKARKGVNNEKAS